jgi:hypothetical protein
LVGVEPNPEAKVNRWPAQLDPGGQLVFRRKGTSMFYVILIIIAVVAAAALFFMRGRRSA